MRTAALEGESGCREPEENEEREQCVGTGGVASREIGEQHRGRAEEHEGARVEQI